MMSFLLTWVFFPQFFVYQQYYIHVSNLLKLWSYRLPSVTLVCSGLKYVRRLSEWQIIPSSTDIRSLDPSVIKPASAVTQVFGSPVSSLTLSAPTFRSRWLWNPELEIKTPPVYIPESKVTGTFSQVKVVGPIFETDFLTHNNEVWSLLAPGDVHRQSDIQLSQDPGASFQLGIESSAFANATTISKGSSM